MTDEQGRFTLNYDPDQDGAEIGKHEVYVMNRADTGAVPGGPAAPTSKELAEFYKKYSAENSKVTVEITPNTRELPLNLD